jgi:hypothetical protein
VNKVFSLLLGFIAPLRPALGLDAKQRKEQRSKGMNFADIFVFQ